MKKQEKTPEKEAAPTENAVASTENAVAPAEDAVVSAEDAAVRAKKVVDAITVVIVHDKDTSEQLLHLCRENAAKHVIADLSLRFLILGCGMRPEWVGESEWIDVTGKDLFGMLRTACEASESEYMFLMDSRTVIVSPVTEADIAILKAQKTAQGEYHISRTCPTKVYRTSMVKYLDYVGKDPDNHTPENLLDEYFNELFPCVLPVVLDWQRDFFCIPVVSPMFTEKVKDSLTKYLKCKKFLYIHKGALEGAYDEVAAFIAR